VYMSSYTLSRICITYNSQVYIYVIESILTSDAYTIMAAQLYTVRKMSRYSFIEHF